MPNPKPELIVESCSDFVGFGENILGKRFYPKQKAVLETLFKRGSKVSFVSCNDGGKTVEVIVTAILAHLCLFPQGRIISTSGSFRQIKDQLQPALETYKPLFPAFDFTELRISTRNPNCFWHGISTADAGKFEGQHEGADGKDLMIIADEGKTIRDPIYTAIDRCRTTRMLLASSAGYAQGEFYRSQTVRRSFYQCYKQTAYECPHITPERIEQMRLKWGEEHPLFKSAMKAEFMPFVEGAVVNLASLDELLADPPVFVPGERKAFCDFAWSESGTGDESVLALRNGNRITIECSFRAKGLHATCARFVTEFQRLGLKSWEIEGDADGDGATIIKQLRGMGWAIGSAHNGGEPRWNEHYANLASEMWCDGARDIINRKWILPDDGELYGQMLDRKIVPNNRGKLCIESKIAMKDPNREGGAVSCSPDRADAVFGAMAVMPMIRSRTVMGGQDPLEHNRDTRFSERTTEPITDGNSLPGAYAG